MTRRPRRLSIPLGAGVLEIEVPPNEDEMRVEDMLSEVAKMLGPVVHRSGVRGTAEGITRHFRKTGPHTMWLHVTRTDGDKGAHFAAPLKEWERDG